MKNEKYEWHSVKDKIPVKYRKIVMKTELGDNIITGFFNRDGFNDIAGIPIHGVLNWAYSKPDRLFGK